MGNLVDLQKFEEDIVRARGRGSISGPKEPQGYDRDRYELAKAGKEQVLKRRFGLLSGTGLSCGLMCTWESLLVVFSIGFMNGGPAGLIYGFMLVWLGNVSVFICIGELASAIPTAGGQYHWVSLLAPRSTKKFFSYVTGWLTVIGWIAALTAVCFFVADLILQLACLNNEGFVREGWHGTLLLWAVLFLCVVINVFISGALPAIEVVVLIVHILGFFGILVPLVYLTPNHNSAKQIFTTFHNEGGWGTHALALFVGLQGNALAFVGTDSVVHMSEEVKNASTVVPRSMLLSLLINGALALGMLFAVLFSANDILGLLEDSSARYSPFIHIFYGSVGSKAGATIMVSIIIFLEFASAMGCLAAASRMTWSFARDGGLPFSRGLSMIDKRSTIPVVSILTVTGFAALLALINIGNNSAFNGTISLVLEGFYLSYLVVLGLLLWKRMHGEMGNTNSYAEATNTANGNEDLSNSVSWGPWRVKGAVGVANNVVAICYLSLIIFFSFWPSSMNPTPEAMNWAVLVTGAVALFSVAYYLIYARKSYTGPIVEIDPHAL